MFEARSLSGAIVALLGVAVLALPSEARSQTHSAQDLDPTEDGVRQAERVPPRSIAYTLTLNATLSEAEVTACLQGGSVERLVPGAVAAWPLLLSAAHVTNLYALPLERTGGAFDVASVPPGGCVRYTLRLPDQPPAQARMRRVGSSVLVDPALLLWRPSPLPASMTATLTLVLPPGTRASVPWEHLAGSSGGDKSPYGLPRSTFEAPAYIAVGPFQVAEIRAPGGTLFVAVLDGDAAWTPLGLKRWLTEAARALSLVYGIFPSDRTQITVEPREGAGYAVPEAEVTSGGGRAIHLQVLKDATDAKLAGEQRMVVHAMAHLLVPRVTGDAQWLLEGVATWYQEVLRARAFGMPPDRALLRLHRGFVHAATQEADRSVVDAATASGRDEPGAWQTWAGVAFALTADVRLRAMGTGDSLDNALAALRTCCLDSDHPYTARELVDLLDRQTRTTIFGTLYEEAAKRRGVPDLARLYELLGVRPGDRKIELTRDATFAHIRDAILSAH